MKIAGKVLLCRYLMENTHYMFLSLLSLIPPMLETVYGTLKSCERWHSTIQTWSCSNRLISLRTTETSIRNKAIFESRHSKWRRFSMRFQEMTLPTVFLKCTGSRCQKSIANKKHTYYRGIENAFPNLGKNTLFMNTLTEFYCHTLHFKHQWRNGRSAVIELNLFEIQIR